MADPDEELHDIYGPIRTTQWGVPFGTPGNIPDPPQERGRSPMFAITVIVAVIVVLGLLGTVAALVLA
jgi:hypothetical protein